jgi:catechol 2,3-dioxygenase-like lactoylglutathione lyase family enzyme
VWTHLDHLILAVRDLPAAERTYARLLGRSASWRGEHPGLGTENALFRTGAAYLELLAPAAGAGEWLRRRLDERGEGLLGFALATDDAEACAKALGERGLHPAAPARGLGRDVESGAFREWRNVMLPPTETRGVLVFGIEHRSAPELLPEVPPAGAPEAAVHGIDHVVIQSADPDATRALYGERLGLRLALDKSFPQWGARLLFFRVGRITVEVAARLDGSGDPSAEDRAWGISWRVADADAARVRLADAGFDVSEVRTGRRPGTRVLSVRGDPCGVATLILEPSPSDSPASAVTPRAREP